MSARRKFVLLVVVAIAMMTALVYVNSLHVRDIGTRPGASPSASQPFQHNADQHGSVGTDGS